MERAIARWAAAPVGLAALAVVLSLQAVDAGPREPEPVAGRLVTLSARDDNAFPRAHQVVDELAAGEVLRIQASGFEEFALGRVMQCVAASVVVCGNSFPVQFDASGQAYFQYLVTDEFHRDVVGSGGCRAGAARCTIVVEDVGAPQRAEVDTIFSDAAPPAGTITVEPNTSLEEHQEVVVRITRYPPGVSVDVMVCAAPAVADPARCGPLSSKASITVGPDGAGRTTLRVRRGPVGTELVECARVAACGVAVFSAEVFARAPVVPISFARGPGASYDEGRLITAMSVALGLLAVAVILVRRTDWAAVGEAAAPEIDDVEYADLDAIVAALPPEPDEALAHHP